MNGERSVVGVRRYLIGQAGPFPRVVFREEVFNQIDRFAQEQTKGEQGGFLVGKKRNLKSLEEYEILVEQFIPLTRAKGATSRFDLTRDDFLAVQHSLQASGSNLRIVGWVHSHPGFGAFLSNFDKELHERLFPRPWNIAYVVDAQHSDRALFHCVDGNWREMPGYYILRPDYGERTVTLNGFSPRWSRILALLLILVVLVGAGVQGYQWLSNRSLGPDEVPSLSETTQQNDTVSREPVVTVGPSTTVVEEPPAQPTYREYVVGPGESLWTIAEKVYGDATLYKLIVEANNITNPARITAGITLIIPEKPSP